MPELRREVLRLEQGPIVCPKCGTVFQGAARVERAVVKEVVEEDEVVQPAGVELVSLDEVEASEEKAAEPAVEDVDVEEDEAEPDDPFIEAEEEDEDDVTNLIDGDIAPTRSRERAARRSAAQETCEQPLWGARICGYKPRRWTTPPLPKGSRPGNENSGP